ncbi:MAG: amidohydrolase [Gemmatimonadetes bacterium]|nr:amidohydrolase [Gemmatimonadota bacterium]
MPQSQNSPEDQVLLRNGRIHPLGGHRPVGALLLRGGSVAALGEDAVALASPTALVVDLAGAAVTPGLVDAHAHPTAWALSRRRVDLRDAPSPEAAARLIGATLPSLGEWIVGQGWDSHRWGAFPTHEILDRVSPAAPVLLESHDLHALWLNGEALRRCGIDRHTPDPDGGRIVRDPATGEPTGVLLEEARRPAFARLPAPGPEEVLSALLDAQASAHELGITGLHSVEPTGLAEMSALLDRDLLRLRVLQHLPLAGLEDSIAAGWRSGSPARPGSDEWLRIGGIKMFLDGALGSRTAWLREPYSGSDDYRGIQTLSREDFRGAVARAAGAGLASAVHAIGDAAVELALDVLEEIPPPSALPHRIEHLQLCPPDLWDRAAASGIVASMQPVHLLSDIPAAEEHWGRPRCRGAYAFAPLLRRGMTLAFGSDVPVETIDPRPGLFAALRRETWTGAWQGEEWYPEQALTAAEALSCYAEGPAAASRDAHRRGSLRPGRDADLVVWDRDPLQAPPEEVREMRCLLTMVGGEIVHRDGV